MNQTQSKEATKSASAAEGPASKLKPVKGTSSSAKIAPSTIGPDLLEKMHAWWRAAGDIATLETVAAAWLLRQYLPQLKVRVVNVVDLMTLCPPDRQPHGMPDDRFISLFTANKPVIFAFHGYPGVIHQLIHGRPEAARFHARGYIEEGTVTAPFDMVVLNKMSRVHLCMDAVRYAPDIRNEGELLAKGEEVLAKHRAYVHEHFEDLPEVRDWVWLD